MQTWTKDGAGWRCEMPGNVTLFATPDRTKGLFGEQAARGTTWRAGATYWEDSPDGVGGTASRFGLDVYMTHCRDAKEAKALATQVYGEEVSARLLSAPVTSDNGGHDRDRT